jgi:hypothetical protein
MNMNNKPDPYWPWPTKDNPLTPWTDKQIKEYNQKQREQLPDAPM